MKKLDKKTFIEKARNVHGNKYDYSNVEYENYNTKICIICPEHGEFWQTPSNHLKGCGCPKCGKELQNKLETKTTKNFILEAQSIHGNKYDYSKVEYINSLKKVCIICPEHGEFWQTPSSHLQGCGCKKCAGFGITTDEWIKKAKKVHGDKYDYSKVNYKGAEKKVCIICSEHGEFWQLPNNHLKGRGCPNCRNYKLETNIMKFLTENKIKFEHNKTFKWLKSNNAYKTLDFYLPEYNAAIECQGIQHFMPTDFANKGNEWAENKFKKTLESDKIKLTECEKRGIKMFYYSELNIKYPYEIYNDKNKLLKAIIKNGTNNIS